jgi:molecular chaperone DnaJ
LPVFASGEGHEDALPIKIGMAGQDGKDLYETLGVSRTASEDEIRKAYRRLARKWHPDINPGDKDAEQRFKEISAAHDVLFDKEKRKLYDEFGHEGLRGGFDPEQARAYQRWTAGRQASGAAGSSTEAGFDFDLDDLFGGFGAERPRAPARGEDLLLLVELDFAEALRGKELEVEVPAKKQCPRCTGSGDEPGTKRETCPECKGTGRRQAVRGPMRIMTTCPVCNGAGAIRTPCSQCGGEGSLPDQQRVRIRIPPGADNGTRLTVQGRGAPGSGDAPPGDLIIETRVRSHPFFRREGLDLFLNLPVTLEEAYDGAKIPVVTPDGSVSLKIPSLSQNGTRLRLRGKGVRRGDQRGDLYVDLAVRLPDVSDPELAEAARKASRLYTRPVREEVRL